MFELYSGDELSEEQLREACDFNDKDIDIANQTQIDFIIVANQEFDEIPWFIKRNIKGGGQCELLHRSFNGIPRTIIIFWH
jgi:hypothetical protein